MSDNNSKSQKLHQLSAQGKPISTEEKLLLQNWYESLDNKEDEMLNSPKTVQSSTDLRKNLANITSQVAKMGNDVKKLITQNDKLRNENKALKKSLESRLLEKAA
jgi:DNA repair exonuclease SbcCD ATPase subunit